MHEIFIYDEIGYFGVTPTMVAEQLRAAAGDDVVLAINSPGGSAFDGIAIHSLVKQYAGATMARIDGIAASAASLVAMACSNIVMAPSAFMMIHEAKSWGSGEADELRKNADLLDALNDTMVTIYAGRSGMAESDVRQAMAEETWYTASEAVANGLADSVDTDAMTAAASFDLRRYQNTPPVLLARAQHGERMTRIGQDQIAAHLRAVLGLSSGTTPDEITAKVEALRDEARDAKAAVQEQIGKVTALHAELAARDEAIVNLQIEAKQAATNAILHELRTEGRLVEGTAFDAMAKGYHDRGDLDGLQQLAAGLREQAPAVPVGKRQSVDDNRPGNGDLQPPPRTASGDVDYDAIAAKLPSETRERFAEVASKTSWRMVLTTPTGAKLMAEAGYQGGAQ